MRRISLAAPAKLNLHLGIYSELDERNYHRADSLMVALDLCDQVVVEELTVPADAESAHALPELVCEPPVGIPAHKNTAYRAAWALAKRTGRIPNVRIELRKHVPDQAGMGGSSSDAAAVLRALCELWDVPANDELVLEAARSVGADVPFFLDPVPTLLVGAGDVVDQKFPPLAEPLPVVLVRPDGPGVSTPAAYAAFDQCPTEPTDPLALCAVLRDGCATAEDIAQNLANNLDPVACKMLPRVAEVRAWLLEQPGVLGGQVTGSGSCIFALCSTEADAARVANDARKMFEVWAQSAHIQ